MANGKPSPADCAAAFSRIVDLLDGEYVTGDDSFVEQASDVAAGFQRDLSQGTAKKGENLKRLIRDLWWFMENVTDDTPDRTERFFALRERVRSI